MDIFDKLVDQILMEFNVEDRNDPAFYDYAAVFTQQLKQRNLIAPGVDVRKTAMQIVKTGIITISTPMIIYLIKYHFFLIHL
jgi:hypothetical protein